MTSPTPKQTAMDVVTMAREGRFEAIVERLAPPLRPLVTADSLRAAWEAELLRCGAVVQVGEPVEESGSPGMAVVKVPVTCERSGVTVIVSVAGTGMLAGLQLASAEAAAPTPPWVPPPYADPSAFTERGLTLGGGALAVGGTISLPISPGRHPAVVLLAGSGPLDRDETLGPNKPLKDLTWGLASRGIAVVRFDKTTFAHPDEVRQHVAFTLTDEYLPAARAAIEELRREPHVDPDRIFVLGHSLGGTVAPRVAAADGSIRGLILLAAGATPLHRSLVRQLRYLASLDEASASSLAPALATIGRQADLIDSDALSASTPASDLPLGTPAPYWMDLRQYDPVATATALGCPILLLQGGRDYQATIEDDLARWQQGLAGRPGVHVHVYPALNHIFAPGTGPVTPAEYQAPQHVHPQVLADVAEWITTAGSAPGAVPF